MEREQKILIDDVLDSLNDREQSIIRLYYICGFTECELAEAFMVSQQMISKIKKRALEKCKQQIGKEN